MKGTELNICCQRTFETKTGEGGGGGRERLTYRQTDRQRIGCEVSDDPGFLELIIIY